jgi:hypothetical protein
MLFGSNPIVTVDSDLFSFLRKKVDENEERCGDLLPIEPIEQ